MFSLLVGCGTIGGSRTIASVDSVVRGEPVYDRDGQYLGRTPLFVDVCLSLDLYSEQVRVFSNDVIVSIAILVGGNTARKFPLMLISGPALSTFGLGVALASGVFLGSLVDTVSGAGFQCLSYIALKNRGMIFGEAQDSMWSRDAPSVEFRA